MNLKKWQIIVIIICLIFGTLLHFVYGLSEGNIIVGIFSNINESTWEHLKLAFYPMLLMAVIGWFTIGKNIPNYWTAQAIGILVAISFITIFFYAYTGIIGTNFAVLNIGAFYVGILLGECIVYKIMVTEKNINAEVISVVLLISLLLSFMVYTFNPPRIPLFEDPVSGEYGI